MKDTQTSRTYTSDSTLSKEWKKLLCYEGHGFMCVAILRFGGNFAFKVGS